MGRSVETVGKNIIYFDATDYEGGFLWGDFVDNLQYAISNRYDSLVMCDKSAYYPYKENRIILENNLIQISIAEYCGCGAVSVFVSQDLHYTIPKVLAEHWLDQTYATIAKLITDNVKVLHRVGTFSNGEAVFRRG